MQTSIGIRVQPSRFAALRVESDSDEEEEEWKQIGKSKNKTKGTAQSGKGSKPPGQQGATGEGGKQLSKNAKKRARKKRNQQSASSESVEGGGVQGEGEGEWRQWKHTDEETREKEFQKELEEAMLQSTLEAEHQAELDRERKAALAYAEREREKEREKEKEKQTRKKKGVTLTLQELHRGTGLSPVSPPPTPQEIQSPSKQQEPSADPHFFERIGEEAEARVKRAPLRERTLSEQSVEESARVAQVMDELEKRDKIIATLKKENEALKNKMKEVKGRNQSLCKILSQGEFSTKAQLLQQIEELNGVKNELTDEIESLHSALEQERSKNKGLKLEIAKFQGTATKGAKTSNH